MKTKLLLFATLTSFFISNPIFATNYVSNVTTGNWGTAATWSPAGIPNAGDNVTIATGHTITMDVSGGACAKLTIDGVASWAAALTTNVGSGGIIINSGGDITGTASTSTGLTTTGGLTLNATLTITSFLITIQTTAGQAISGTGSLPRLTINATTTNNGDITVRTALGGASTLTQGTGSILTIGATSVTPTLDASTNSNTVNYNHTSSQTVKSTTYRDLIISNTGTSTLGGAITVNGDLVISGGTLATSTFQITGNLTGTFSMTGTAILTIGNTLSSTTVNFPTLFTTANISLVSTSRVTYQGNYAQVISSAPAYGDLYVNTFSGSKTADGNITVARNLVVTSPSTLDMTTNTINVTGGLSSTGGLSFTSGTLNIGGSNTNTGSFTYGTGTVNYNGSSSAQTVRAVQYNNLTLSGTASKTLQNTATVLFISGNFDKNATVSSVTVTGNTVSFNGGAAQNITGAAMTFGSLTIANTSGDVTLGTNIAINTNRTFTLTSGNIITGTNTVACSTGVTTNRTSGHIVGNLQKAVATGSSVSSTFEVGTGSNYTPFDITFAIVSVAGTFKVSTTSGDHSQIGTSGFDDTKTVNRTWSLTNTGITFTNYDATCTFVDGDKDATLNTTVCIIKANTSGTWSSPGVGDRTANSTEGRLVTIPTAGNTTDFQIGETVSGSSTGNLYSIVSAGNWVTAGTWSETSGGASCGCIPSTTDSVIIENGNVITMDASISTIKALYLKNGVANWTTTSYTTLVDNSVTIDATGDITGTVNGVLSCTNLILNKALTTTSVIVSITLGTGQTSCNISGTGSLPKLDISSDATNNGNITITSTGTSALTGLGRTLTQGAGAIITYSGTTTSANMPTIDAGTNDNTFEYNATGSQPVKGGTGTSYYNLIIRNNGTSTLGGIITVSNDLTVSGGTTNIFNASTFQITGNATGALSLAASTGLTLAGSTSFPTLFTDITLDCASTVTYSGTLAQTIQALDYGTLAISGARTTRSVTFEAAIGICNNTTTCFNPTAAFTTGGYITTGSTIDFKGTGAQTIRAFNYNNLTISGARTTNSITLISAGTIGISGVFNPTAIFTTGDYITTSNTINYNGTGAQTITDFDYNSLTISGSNVTAPASLNIAGDFTNNGTFDHNDGTIIFNGSGAQSITGSALNKTLYNVTISNTGGSVSLGSSFSLINTLTLGANSTFVTTGQTFTLVSTDATNTARIAAIPLSATFTGNITAQQFIPGTRGGWGFLGSPCSSSTIADWEDDLITTGYTGSDYPTSSFISIQSFNESAANSFTTGYTPMTNVTNSIGVAEGFWVYLQTNGTTGTIANFVLDVTGPPNTDDVNLGVTYTDGDADEDGWNLVANPYPCTIDWDDADWTKTNMANAIYFWNADVGASGGYATYVEGVPVNGGTQYIAAHQGFYVKANAASPSLIVTENTKSTTQNPVFRGDSTSKGKIFRLYLDDSKSNPSGFHDDETVIRIHPQATDTFDNQLDASKLFGFDTSATSIYTIMNGHSYTVNSIPFMLGKDYAIPVKAKSGINGKYTITHSSLDELPPSTCVVLEDLANKKKFDLRQDSAYTFTLKKNADFILHISSPISITETSISATCPKVKDGKIIVTPNGTGIWNYVWKNIKGETIKTTTNTTKSDTLENLDAGKYMVIINKKDGCGDASFNFTIPYDTTFVTKANFVTDTITSATVKFKNKSDYATEFKWDFGDNTTSDLKNPTHTYLTTGTFTVKLISSNSNCAMEDSVFKTVQITSTTSIKNLNKENNFSILNNANGVFVKFNLEQATNAIINVYNLLGQKVVSETTLKAHRQQAPLPLLNDNAIYFINIVTDSENETYKIVR